ncbi:MAG: tyrosine-type recombinase/integrase [Gaiellaceae bacterium]
MRRFGIRFRDQYGKRRFESLGPVSASEAAKALDTRLAEVKVGVYRPPTPAPIVELPTEEPTFHEYASAWLTQREAEGLRPKTLVDLRWSLVNHLLPFFAGHRLSEITPREVKRYTQAKLAERNTIEQACTAAKAKGEPFTERPLSNGSVNHTLRHLSQVLEAAVDDELLASNPAAGSRRRLKAGRPARPWVEPEQLVTFLGAAPRGVGRVLLAILAGAGLRIGEALALRWRDVDLGTGTLYVRDAKTTKGIREVHLTPALRELLALWRADTKHADAADFVVCTSTGRKHNPSNLRRDVLAKTVTAANVKLEEAGIAPIGSLTFHGLRRTYASLRCVCGDDMRYTADQLGHEDARFTMRCYAQASKRRDRMAKPQQKAYDAALEWAAMGSNVDIPAAMERAEAA